MAVIAYGIGLALIWVLAWGTPTPANILGGLLVAALLLWASPDTRPARWDATRLRPLAILRFTGHVLAQVVTANVQLTRTILRKEARLRTAVIAVPLPPCSDGLLTLITNVMAVTPGTMPVEVTHDPTVLYVHALLLGDVEDARREVAHLADLAYAAFGPSGARP
jgi:multicomponent Na+:H+ antiporter subunit E